MWHVATTAAFDEWFADLDEDGQVELIAKVELLKLLGPKLGRPHADTLNGSKHANMKELRADTADKVLRVAFAFDPSRAGIHLGWKPWTALPNGTATVLDYFRSRS